jgi:hypothetical protein
MRAIKAGLAAVFAILCFASGALAQQPFGIHVAGDRVRVLGPGAPVQVQTLLYSYYVSAPNPARVYAGLGSGDQFPFYGRPYGNPGDRWSWYYMGGGANRYLAKYYYPILP